MSTKGRRPVGSRNVSHVPPPDPAFYTPFTIGEKRTIGLYGNSALTFCVTRLHDAWIEGVQTLGEQSVLGELDLDRPMVIAKDPATGGPIVTLTLREIRDGQAFIQVTVRSDQNIQPRPEGLK